MACTLALDHLNDDVSLIPTIQYSIFFISSSLNSAFIISSQTACQKQKLRIERLLRLLSAFRIESLNDAHPHFIGRAYQQENLFSCQQEIRFTYHAYLSFSDQQTSSNHCFPLRIHQTFFAPFLFYAALNDCENLHEAWFFSFNQALA